MTTSDSRRSLITGIAAQTEASKRTCTPPSAAAAMQLGTGARDELLVRGHDRHPLAQELEHVAARRLEPAHDLGDERDLGVAGDRAEVVGEETRFGCVLALPRWVANQRTDDAEPVADRALDVVRAVL